MNERMSAEKLHYIKRQLNYKKQHLLTQFMLAVQNQRSTNRISIAKIYQTSGKIFVMSSTLWIKRKFERSFLKLKYHHAAAL
jgi:hypothetical protein